LHPKHSIAKRYYLEYEGTLGSDVVSQFKEGIRLASGELCRPALLVPLQNGNTASSAELIIHEGMYHQVKRMMLAVNCKVVYLKRLAIGSLRLDDKLSPGDYRELTAEEIRDLKSF
jgi:16S rRNA pseudouridine516 synthase